MAALALSSCGKVNEVLKGSKQAAEQPKLQGTWRGGCSAAKVVQNEQIFYQFKGENFTEVHAFSGDSNCKDATGQIIYSGHFGVKSDNNDLDLNYAKVEVVALNSTGQTFLEGLNFCGEKSYPVGQKRTIQPSGLCPLKTIPSTELSLHQSDGTTLFLGNSGTAKTRATDLDKGHPYTTVQGLPNN